jgi:hypothetical protein
VGETWDEWREEQADAARDAAIVWRHRRDFRDRLRDAMARGDRIALRAGAASVTGLVIEVDADLVALRDVSGERVDVRLDREPRLLLRVVEAAAGAGCTPPLSSGGFRGRLLSAESGGSRYRVQVCGEPESLEGRIAVGLDHIDIIGDDVAMTVPLALIAWVSPTPSTP